jgi:ectoine hydroxylase-related dioxygenase (phytanoyl-CoA dioxygenase family)
MVVSSSFPSGNIPNCVVAPTVPKEQRVEAFQRDGCLFVPSLLPPSLVDELAAAIDDHVAHKLSKRVDITTENKDNDIASRASNPRFIMDYCNYYDIPAYRKIAKHIASQAAALMKSKTVRVYQDQVLIKEPGTLSANTIWHSDAPYLDIEGSQTINFWIPVDTVPRESALECVAGSHLKGPYIPRSYKTNQPLFDVPGGIDIPEVNENREAFPILGWEFQPGDGVFNSLACLHGAVEGSREGRRVLALRLIGDDVKVVEKPHFVVSSLGNKDYAGKEFPLVWDNGPVA